jgi:hypothetical protein
VSTAAAAAGDLQARLVYPRAVEATTWGMPAVSMAAIRRSLGRDLDADFGDIIYFSNVMAPRHEFLTANNQTPYVFTFFDLRRGPMVLQVPLASAKVTLFGIDSWEVPLVDVGPTGEDAGKGGRYLFLPPDFDGQPPDGFIVVASPTWFVHFRTVSKNGPDAGRSRPPSRPASSRSSACSCCTATPTGSSIGWSASAGR